MVSSHDRLSLKYDILADWLLNLYCNFSCPYCFWSNDSRLKDKNFLGHTNIDQIVDFFNKSGKTWLIHMSGGEPFMHPRYIELCHKLTKKHYISINTNLTFNSIDEFINEVDPERVAFLHCSLHYQERVKHYNVSSFIKKYHKLKDAGYHIYVTQVFYPPVIPLFHRIVEEFGKENIVIRPKLFRGLFEKKLYPQQYTAEEKQMFRHYLIMAERHEKIYETHIDPNLDRDFFMKELSFKGKMCSAGQDFVNVHFNGDIVRCHASTSVMGNIFKGNLHLLKDTTTCPFTICPCPYYGLRYTQNEPLSLLT